MCALVLVGCAGGRAGVRPDVSTLVTLEADSIKVRESISFAHGQAELDVASLDLLDAVAQIMKTTDGVKLLTIEGHTDNTGEPDLNLPLSESRAGAVKRYLESKGVASARLASKGFGASQPVDTNDTEEGRARNRRVVFKVTR